jgi:chemotaxis protein methyltransferase CheR
MDTGLDTDTMRLLGDIRAVYGHDFLGYSGASLQRRLTQWLRRSGYGSVAAAHAPLLREPLLFDSLVRGITVNVTSMFRDPEVFRALRDTVLPQLRTYPFVRIWHAGCASGEEVYSMAILLHEAGMQGRYRIYATDLNDEALSRASDGIYPIRSVQDFTRNYQHSGGLASFADYYSAQYGHAVMAARLKEHIVFASHNLATDGSIGEMHLVFCRNVLIYFDAALKERCHALFDESLAPGGYLCLGNRERLQRPAFAAVGAGPGLYRKRHDR